MTSPSTAHSTGNNVPRRLLCGVVLLGALLSSACSMHSSNPIDPFEPANRGIYKFNNVMDDNVIEPAAEGYRHYTPLEVRTAVSHFFDNLRDMNSTVNYVLQAKPMPALTHFTRVLMNSTLGVVGLFDVAGDAGLTGEPTSFGDTFAAWGWKKSIYVVLPFLGPSTVRDGSGTLLGISATNAIYPTAGAQLSATALNSISVRERLLGLDDTIEQAAIDPYAYMRDGWMQMRAKELGEAAPTTHQNDEDLNIDDLVDSSNGAPPAAVSKPTTPASKKAVVHDKPVIHEKPATQDMPAVAPEVPRKKPQAAPKPAKPEPESGATKAPIKFSESEIKQ